MCALAHRSPVAPPSSPPGIVCPNDGVLLNPGRLALQHGDKAIVLARSLEEASAATAVTYNRLPEASEYDELCDVSELLSQCQSHGEPRCPMRAAAGPTALRPRPSFAARLRRILPFPGRSGCATVSPWAGALLRRRHRGLGRRWRPARRC